jgi:Family of unknown function (DUF695)
MTILADDYVLAQGVIDGVATIMRVATARPMFFLRRRMKHLVIVSWRVEPANFTPAGRKGDALLERMEQLEVRMVEALIPQRLAVLAGVVTTQDAREWSWYTRDKDQMFAVLNRDIPDIDFSIIDISHQIDADWQIHADMLGCIRGR